MRAVAGAAAGDSTLETASEMLELSSSADGSKGAIALVLKIAA